MHAKMVFRDMRVMLLKWIETLCWLVVVAVLAGCCLVS